MGLHCTGETGNGPGQSCKLVDNATTSQTHSFDARVPRANHASSMPSSVPVERRASRLIQLEIYRDLCTFAAADRKTFKPPVI